MNPNSTPQDQDILQFLQELKSIQDEYPPDLLAARRAAFIGQVVRGVAVEEELSPQDEKIIDLVRGLWSVGCGYPSEMIAARRAAYVNHVTKLGWVVLWNNLRSAIQNRLAQIAGERRLPAWEGLRTSLIIAGLALAAYAGFLSYGNRTQSLNPLPSGGGISQSVSSPEVINTAEVEVICKPGYLPPLCLATEFDKSQDLTFQGNGSARPAVAMDTIPGYSGIHQPANINDGLYGPGASWISNSANSWIKIDLGKATAINTVTFGRDRLGTLTLNDRDPGRFVIAVALFDDVYANGNNNNDEIEYTEVFDSEQEGFSGTITDRETVMAQFESRTVRFIKITFENPGTAIDEVEVFMLETPVAQNPTKKPSERQPVNSATPLPTSTALPSNTPLPTNSATPLPTSTPIPTNTPTPTSTPLPTHTPMPTITQTPIPTNTSLPPDTPTPLPTVTLLPTVTTMPTSLSTQALLNAAPGFNRNLSRSTISPLPSHPIWND
jgi:hypothetical protein